jgi:hypothetical protein
MTVGCSPLKGEFPDASLGLPCYPKAVLVKARINLEGRDNFEDNCRDNLENVLRDNLGDNLEDNPNIDSRDNLGLK